MTGDFATTAWMASTDRPSFLAAVLPLNITPTWRYTRNSRANLTIVMSGASSGR